MAVSTVKLNGQTLMTVNDTTATASDVINKYFYAADGTKTLGTASGGSTPTLITKSITANGTYDAEDDSADGYSSVTVNVSGGGGEGGNPDDDVVFIDYDGTVLHSYSASDFQALSAMPANPSHTGLTAQGWNWSLTDAKAQVTAMGRCIIGQLYNTSDGKTRIYCHFSKGRLSPLFGICPNGTVTVDWGDNSSTDSLTGTSLTGLKTVEHNYASAGDYVITLTPATGTTFAFYGTSNTSNILRKSSSTTANLHVSYTSAIRKIEMGASARIGQYAFYNCYNLESINIHSDITVASGSFEYCTNLSSLTLPTGVTSVPNSLCYYCYSIRSISLPKGLTTITSNGFYYCYGLDIISLPSALDTFQSNGFRECSSLSSITIPSGVTTLPSYAFGNCRGLVSVTLPSTLTTLTANAFTNCYGLASLTIPANVTNIPANTFSGCYGMGEYHFLATTPPTLAATSAFSNIQSDCKIYVPKSTNQTVLNTYKSTSNWSQYSSYMEEEP